MAGISSKAAGKLENRFKYNDGTELENKEFSDGSGLELYSTDFRSYDPQIGRFHRMDPMADEFERWSLFAFAFNNPILLNDPLGLASDSTNAAGFPNSKGGKSNELDNVTVTASRKSANNSNGPSIAGFGMAFGGMALPLGGSGGIGLGAASGTVSASTAGVAAAIIGLVIVNELARRATAERWYITYYKVGKNGKVYVGRCSGFGSTPEEVLERYDKTHRMNNRGFNSAAILDKALAGSVFLTGLSGDGIGSFGMAEVSGYAITRGREQQLYDDFKSKGF